MYDFIEKTGQVPRNNHAQKSLEDPHIHQKMKPAKTDSFHHFFLHQFPNIQSLHISVPSREHSRKKVM